MTHEAEMINQLAKREALITSIDQKIQGDTNVENTLQVTLRELGNSTGAQTRVRLKPTDGLEDRGPLASVGEKTK